MTYWKAKVKKRMAVRKKLREKEEVKSLNMKLGRGRFLVVYVAVSVVRVLSLVGPANAESLGSWTSTTN